MLNFLFSLCFLTCLFLSDFIIVHNMILAFIKVYASKAFYPNGYESFIDHSNIVIFSHITLLLLLNFKTKVTLLAQILVVMVVFYLTHIPEGESYFTLPLLTQYKLFVGYLDTLMYYSYTPALLCIYYLYILSLMYLSLHVCSLVTSKTLINRRYFKLAFKKMCSTLLSLIFVIILAFIFYVLFLAVQDYVLIQIEDVIDNICLNFIVKNLKQRYLIAQLEIAFGINDIQTRYGLANNGAMLT